MTGLPAGVELRRLEPHADDRGSFTELFREAWPGAVRPRQWNAVRSEAGVVRGVHVHVVHDDYFVLLSGRASVGLRDMRPASPTAGMVALVEVSGDDPQALTIPHGVAHGFHFHEPSLHVYAVTEYWSDDDELGCRYDDPDLGIPWAPGAALVSARDRDAPPFTTLVDELSGRAA